MKTSELTGAALDWAVAQCEGLRVEHDYQYTEGKKFDGWWQLGPNCWQPLREYSSDWAQGGPIIEREGMTVALDAFGWEARHYDGESEPWVFIGDTPLIAAMRCYVASKLGDEVQIPEILK